MICSNIEYIFFVVSQIPLTVTCTVIKYINKIQYNKYCYFLAGNPILSSVFVALAAYISMYPIILCVPVAVYSILVCKDNWALKSYILLYSLTD